MSLNKAIKHNKEKRKEYRGAKAIDCTCRNHGSCPWCKENRVHFDTKRRKAADSRLKDYKNNSY